MRQGCRRCGGFPVHMEHGLCDRCLRRKLLRKIIDLGTREYDRTEKAFGVRR